MRDLIIELGCEELPAASMLPLAQHLGQSLASALRDTELCSTESRIFATPRRLAAYFTDVGER